MSRCHAKIINPANIFFAFDADAHPDLSGPLQFTAQFQQPIGTLRQHLILMPLSPTHYREDLLDVVDRDDFMEEIAHRIDEDAPRTLPSERQFQHLWLQGDFETIVVVWLAHGFESLRKPLRITMLAARAYFRTSGYWIPGRICPLDV